MGTLGMRGPNHAKSASHASHASATSRMPSRAVVALASALAPLAAGCLPGDTRPVPESVYVTVEPSQALKEGIETADGWRITFDRLLLGVGNLDFEWDDPSCNTYAEAHYDRLFDFAVVSGREKVGIVFGLNTCRLEFRLREPSFDALLGPGATVDDLKFMRQRGTDNYAEDERASVYAKGLGTRGDEVMEFRWLFRRSYEITDCALEGGGFATDLELTEGAASELQLEVRGEELFRVLPDDAAELRFQPIADADANGDGVVSLKEMSQMPPPVVDAGGLGPGEGSSSGSSGGPLDEEVEVPETLEGLVYEQLLPRLLRVAGAGACEAEERNRRR